MKIALLKHKSLKDSAGKYLEKIASALDTNPNIIFGPDYALCFSKDNFDFEKRKKFISKIETLSLNCPKTLIIPGTAPRLIEKGIFRHSSPVIQNGRTLMELDKETDCGESESGEKVGLDYQRGDYRENNIFYEGKKIAVEICSDHGKQPISYDTFLEAILAYDNNAGFWIRANNDNFSRWAVLINGLDGTVGCFRYEHLREGQKYGTLLPEIDSRDFSVYNLKNGKKNVSFI